MSTCHGQASAAIALYFYGELAERERDAVEQHLQRCADCRRALDELSLIRTALATRPVVSSPAGGDWSGFMTRLDAALRAESTPANVPEERRVVAFRPRSRVVAALATAAVVALVTASVLLVNRERRIADTNPPPAAVPGVASAIPAEDSRSAAADAAFSQLSGQHFERSKLVVLGLATKDPGGPAAADWEYERTLATTLLDDTRLYRQAAEARGMKPLADVMRDLELVLLETSMSEAPDAGSLERLQRLIRRRDLITKMEVVGTTGLLP